VAKAQKRATKQALRREAEVRVTLFLGIGRFTYQFSQLEFTIRALLAGALRLRDEQFDLVTSSYDFRTLCKVTSEIYLLKKKDDEPARANIATIFKECLALNDERVRMAHGTWSVGAQGHSARHVSRQTLKSKQYFEQKDEIEKHATAAEDLMQRMLLELGR